MKLMRGSTVLALSIAISSTIAMAEDTKCNLFSANSALAIDYNQIGTEACTALCKGTEGCIAWVYTPHNFNPKKAPGECRLLPDIRSEEASNGKFCGKL